MINYSKFVKNSRKWLTNYIKANHLQSCILGISGGIDSTVSCAIASPVCKELNIPLIGRSLPTETNSPSENNIAELVGSAFCSDFKSIDITEITNEMVHELELCEGKLSKLQIGNIKARYRMIYLYNLASIHSGCVIDNDNFTEYNLGFYTIHGDQGDINLGLHYLWKTEVYELAHFLLKELDNVIQETYKDYSNDSAEKQYEALSESLKLNPTDGNGVATGGDCGQFGLDNYEQVDDVLKTMYYNDKFFEQWAENKQIFKGPHPEYLRLIDSYNEQGVDKVMVLHQNTAYKRKELPIKPTKEELGL